MSINDSGPVAHWPSSKQSEHDCEILESKLGSVGLQGQVGSLYNKITGYSQRRAKRKSKRTAEGKTIYTISQNDSQE